MRGATEIVDAVLDTPVWSGKFDGLRDDPFGVQEQVATGIVEGLHVQLTEKERAAISTRPIGSPVAYDYYRRVTAESYTFSEPSLLRAETLVAEAMAIEGENAALLAASAAVQWQWVNAGFDTSDSRLARALQQCARALEVDPACVDARATQAWIHSGTARLNVALIDCVLVVGIAPTHGGALAVGAVVAWVQGRFDLVARFVRQSLAIDPFDPWSLVVDAAHRAAKDDPVARDRALARVNSVVGTAIVRFVAGMLCAQDGDTSQAFDWWSRVAAAGEDGPFPAMARASLKAREGDSSRLLALLDGAEYSRMFVNDRQFAWHMTELLAMHGRLDEAIATLGQAVRCEFCNLLMLEGRDATLRPLHADPRYQSLLAEARERHAELDGTLRSLDATAAGP